MTIMSGSKFGNIFRVMTFGESHGPYIGVVIDGLMPGLPIDEKQIQYQMDRRRPGQSEVVTPRSEDDKAQIVSGVFEGNTTGTPMCILIKNKDQRSRDYGNIKSIFRPGHASFTFLKKYGIFDYRGGGRASGRETACRVAAGAVARQFLSTRGIDIYGFTRQISDIVATEVDRNQIEQNVVRSPDAQAAKKMIAAVLAAKEEGDSLGGVIEIRVNHLPAGLGEPVFDKLEADLAAALMSIGAVKAFEMGSGFAAAGMKGSESNDGFTTDESGTIRTVTNQAGGVLGGISNGEELLMRITVKPPSSIAKVQQSVSQDGKAVAFSTGGRHDPCICPRVVPVAEAMVAMVLMDHILMQERISDVGEAGANAEKVQTIDHQLLLLLAQRQKLIETGAGAELADSWLENAREIGLPETQLKDLRRLLYGK